MMFWALLRIDFEPIRSAWLVAGGEGDLLLASSWSEDVKNMMSAIFDCGCDEVVCKGECWSWRGEGSFIVGSESRVVRGGV